MGDQEFPDPFDVPDIGMSDEEVEETPFEYSDRAPGDWVISGPLGAGRGPGRYFSTWREASAWVRWKYRERAIRPIEYGALYRWAWLIAGDKRGDN